jgi:hypothetical protein
MNLKSSKHLMRNTVELDICNQQANKFYKRGIITLRYQTKLVFFSILFGSENNNMFHRIFHTVKGIVQRILKGVNTELK